LPRPFFAASSSASARALRCIAILENFLVGKLWIGREVASPALARLEHSAAEKNIRVEHEARGRPSLGRRGRGYFLAGDFFL